MVQDGEQVEKHKILLAEDDPRINSLLTELFLPYEEFIQIKSAVSVKEAYQFLFSESGKPHHSFKAIILDIMMPYGSEDVKTTIDGSDDDQSKESGYLLLKYLRKQETLHHRQPVWVNVITARNAPDVLHNINQELGRNGRLEVKPFNDFALEKDICTILDIECNEPDYLLPENYTPPVRTGANL